MSHDHTQMSHHHTPVARHLLAAPRQARDGEGERVCVHARASVRDGEAWKGERGGRERGSGEGELPTNNGGVASATPAINAGASSSWLHRWEWALGGLDQERAVY